MMSLLYLFKNARMKVIVVEVSVAPTNYDCAKDSFTARIRRHQSMCGQRYLVRVEACHPKE
jgi:hypothetical protein